MGTIDILGKIVKCYELKKLSINVLIKSLVQTLRNLINYARKRNNH